MIWSFLCFIGRHDWRPVFKHRVTRQGQLTSLVRCYRVGLSGRPCGAERYTVSKVEDWTRGGQLK